jgi:hypothetical protein
MSYWLITPHFGVLDLLIIVFSVFVGLVFNYSTVLVALAVGTTYAFLWVLLYVFEERVRDYNDLRYRR